MLQQYQGPTAQADECGEGQVPSAGGSPAHPLPSPSLHKALPSDAVAGWEQRFWQMPPQVGSPRTFPPPHQNFPISCASNCSRDVLYWDSVQTTRSLCNWLSLQVPFWLPVWKQNSVAKHYLFFMSLLLLCQGSGINFGCFIEKISFCVSFLQLRIK